eukprot:GHUV01032143.1.p1 GENE.GHUV01032143.1~~GHUV01032143.1.p1  ORF type:complete len:149 (-),score=36.03 GHUV01032143.1:209-655(-)
MNDCAGVWLGQPQQFLSALVVLVVSYHIYRTCDISKVTTTYQCSLPSWVNLSLWLELSNSPLLPPAVYSRHPEIQDAVSALARHICLKAQDKADSRTAATKACAELVTDLPQWEQEQFVGFVFNLSRTKQVGRCIGIWLLAAAVEGAH